MKQQDKKLATIKVLPESVSVLNFIAAHHNIKQYETVNMLAEKEKKRILKALTK